MAKKKTSVMGRPPIYDDEFHPKNLIDLMKEGKTNVQCCSEWDISEETFYAWIKTHKNFSESYKKGKTHLNNWWINKGHDLMTLPSRETNPAIFIWMTRNILGWKDKIEVSEEDKEPDSLVFEET